jgi:hypothetical protein
LVDPDPAGPRVDPLGEELISELPEGLVEVPPGPVVVVPAPPIPVVAPGALAPPGARPVEEPLMPPLEDAPPDVPPAPPACANASELESASAPANANVANFMVVSLAVESDRQPREMADVPALVCEAGGFQRSNRDPA